MNKEKNSGGRIRKPQHGRRLRWGKQFILLAAIAVLALGIVGGTTAYLLTNTGNVVNTFAPGYVSCEINEDFESPYTEKSNVTVKNTGNTDAYIRAAIIVTWLDKETGNAVASVPDGYSYTMTVNGDNKWILYDGYYYYPTPVSSGSSTDGSLLNCTVSYPTDPKYTLSVEILADAIQSSPANAVGQAWGVSISEGSVTEYSAGGNE